MRWLLRIVLVVSILFCAVSILIPTRRYDWADDPSMVTPDADAVLVAGIAGGLALVASGACLLLAGPAARQDKRQRMRLRIVPSVVFAATGIRLLLLYW